MCRCSKVTLAFAVSPWYVPAGVCSIYIIFFVYTCIRLPQRMQHCVAPLYARILVVTFSVLPTDASRFHLFLLCNISHGIVSSNCCFFTFYRSVASNILWPIVKQLLYILEGIVIVYVFRINLTMVRFRDAILFLVTSWVFHYIIGCGFIVTLLINGVPFDGSKFVNSCCCCLTAL